MVVGSTENGLYLDGFKYFCEMQENGIRPDKFTYSAAVQSCIGLGSVELGEIVHAQIVKSGFSGNVFVSTSLVNMYAKCGELEDSVRVFNAMHERNQVSWNSMISGLVSNGLHLEAYDHFIEMKKEGFAPTIYTFASVLKAVGKLGNASKGREVHESVTEFGMKSSILVGTALIDMYSKCGCLSQARLAFDLNFTDCKANMPWNAVISAYSQCGQSKEALKLFTTMCLKNVELDHFTYASVFNAIANYKYLQFVKEVHAVVVKSGYDSRVLNVNNAMANAYSKCGSLEDARIVFERMEERDLVSWTTMVTAHATNLEGDKALAYFSQMREEGFTPNEFTIASVLVGCASLGLLEYGRHVHNLLCKTQLGGQECVESALIDMYAKCGNLIDAEKVFEKVVNPDVVSWTAIISGHAQHGSAEKALQLFKKMEEVGVRANSVTLLCVLFACSHSGLVKEGLHHFQLMEEKYGVVPEMEHYACVIDILGRVGRLNDAVEFIRTMPMKPSEMVWQTLLAACRVHGNVELGEVAAKELIAIKPDYSATYVLLSNTYIEKGSLEDAQSLRDMMRDRGVKKEPGLSWISVKGAVHKFFSGDQYHPQKEEIFAKLDGLREKMKAMGYVPDLKYVLLDVE
ncbi:hypothetical protein GIB67_020234 [Kingdonia uniflora]|uniref:Pentatricopeptide repeat-containing protein n=1 Tax=Kingdonia uniflora TaxID=39325 RepID=A0A7J7P462_9MAGN|nr:hypothetical protein GIB67_020234 [Kingdonia uniflora]